MLKLSIVAVTTIFVSTSSFAAEPQCNEYEKLRTQRDSALARKDLGQYCQALAGLIMLHPVGKPDGDKLKCEAGERTVTAWLSIRPRVLAAMKETYEEQCK